MPEKIAPADANYFLGFDGGGTKTECVLADSNGRIIASSKGGPSNPVRAGYARAWFSLSEAADAVLKHEKITSRHIRGICAGLGGAGRAGVARRVKTFFERGYPNSQVHVTTDLELALEAAFGVSEGIILLIGTGSAAFGRDANGKTARAGGRGPWVSDEGSAFDIGRRAVQAVALAEERRGPATSLSGRIFEIHQARTWDQLGEQISKNADSVFPKTFPLVAGLAAEGDAVSREILASAAVSLAGLAACVAAELGWRDRDVPIAKVGGASSRSRFFDSAIDAELKKQIPRVTNVTLETSPAEAAVRMAVRQASAEGHAA
ncbi:MAG TPA: BadF/BadG/BcrA/BcrD ATPase family protein [Candidatus Acidoferrales bacterium]|nr:BadF/BadG/BcrA/BcrD ATPase family protein [Candidatus Acidoferrales bacterium]